MAHHGWKNDHSEIKKNHIASSAVTCDNNKRGLFIIYYL